MDYIKRWIKRILRALLDWAKDDESDYTLDVVLGGKSYRATALHSHGMMLMCSIDMEIGVAQRLVSLSQARDRQRFQKLWRRLGGGKGLTWEDGDPFEG